MSKAIINPLRLKESDIKLQIKSYLALKGIFSWPVTQGIASYRGAPDRIMHLNGRVVYLEIKLPNGKMSEAQLAFQSQSYYDGIDYQIIRSLEYLQALVECSESALESPTGDVKAQSSGIIPPKKRRA